MTQSLIQILLMLKKQIAVEITYVNKANIVCLSGPFKFT